MKTLTLAAALLLLAPGCGTGGDGSPTDDSAAPPSQPDATTWPLYLVPADLPPGVRVDYSFVGEGGGAGGGGWTTVVGRPEGDGFSGVVQVIVAEAAGDREVSESEARGLSYVDVNGHRARLTDTGTIGASIDWFAGGQSFALIGPSGAKNDVVAVARAVRPGDRPSSTAMGALPAGYETVATLASPGGKRQDYTIHLSSETERGRAGSISVSRMEDASDSAAIATFGAVLRRTTVRGHDGWHGLRRSTVGDLVIEHHTLAWAERPDVVVSVSGTLDKAQVRVIAEGLRETDEATWRATVKPR